MGQDFLIRTIEDMERLYYSKSGMALLSQFDMVNPFITKDDAPVITSTGSVRNIVYGAEAWVMFNQEANTFAALPKIPWDKSGWRVISARPTTFPHSGVTDAGTLNNSIKPTWLTVSATPKIVAPVFETGMVQEIIATETNDDATGSLQDLRPFMAADLKENVNNQLNTENGTLAGNYFESIDRVVGTYSEITNCKQNDESTAYTTGDLDIFSQDRDASTTFDAYVSHNSSTVRSLTDSIIQTIRQNTLKNGANREGQWWQTGYDTWSCINQLYDTQVRYNILGEKPAQIGINGINTQPGITVGTTVATLLNRPLIESKNTVVDTGGISRLYLLDTSNPDGQPMPRLAVSLLRPVQYFEAGVNQGTPFAVGKLSTKGMYTIVGEVKCTFFGAQGKARDLKA